MEGCARSADVSLGGADTGWSRCWPQINAGVGEGRGVEPSIPCGGRLTLTKPACLIEISLQGSLGSLSEGLACREIWKQRRSSSTTSR